MYTLKGYAILSSTQDNSSQIIEGSKPKCKANINAKLVPKRNCVWKLGSWSCLCQVITSCSNFVLYLNSSIVGKIYQQPPFLFFVAVSMYFLQRRNLNMMRRKRVCPEVSGEIGMMAHRKQTNGKPFRRMYFPSLHHLPALSVEKPLSLLVSFSSPLSFIFSGREPVTILSKFYFPDENTDH